MATVPAPLARVIQELTKLPGIGEKTATRLAFHLSRTERRDVEALAAALAALRDDLRVCSLCCALAGSDPCDLCGDPRRSADIVCVVEESADLAAVERSGGFGGRYHVLGGTLSPLDGIGPDDLNVTPLLRRIGEAGIREVIIATNPTTEGEATALYLARSSNRSGFG
jgi:recombination protein RecR